MIHQWNWTQLLFCAFGVHCAAGTAVAQVPASTDSTEAFKNAAEVKVAAYVEVYYAYDFGQPTSGDRPFLYNFNRHNEVALNLGLARVDYTNNRVRGAFALMAGTYPQANLAQEPTLMRNVFEAHVGVRLSRKKAIWLDAGILPSHIGMESAVGIDNWTLTRSLNAENSPYYLSGVQVSWDPSKKLRIAALYVNGWQRIRRVQNNTPCFGTQVLWTPNQRMKLNWSTFLGSDTPDSLGLYRIFNNAWWSWEGEKWGAKVAADVGIQEIARSTKWNLWADGVIVLRRRLGKQLFATARGEYYYDPHQVIVYVAPPIIGSPRGLAAMGYSLGLDYQITANATVRLEGRMLRSTHDVFEFQDRAAQDNSSVTVSIAAKF